MEKKEKGKKKTSKELAEIKKGKAIIFKKIKLDFNGHDSTKHK